MYKIAGIINFTAKKQENYVRKITGKKSTRTFSHTP
jgi:hypothetical protein